MPNPRPKRGANLLGVVKSPHGPISLLAVLALLSSQLPGLAGNLPLYCKYSPGRGLTPEEEARCAEDPAKAQTAKKKADRLQPPTYPFRASFSTVEPTSGNLIVLAQLSEDGSEITFDYGKNKVVLKPAQIISWKLPTQALEPTPAPLWALSLVVPCSSRRCCWRHHSW